MDAALPDTAALRAQLLVVVAQEGSTELSEAESRDLIQEINTYTNFDIVF